MRKHILIYSLIVTQLGCQPITPKMNVGDEEFSLMIPEVSYFRELADGNVAATTLPNEPLSKDDWRIEVFKLHQKTCSNLGVSSPDVRNVASAQILTGIVDAIPWDQDPPPEPNCMVGVPSSISPYTRSYMLCSEKNERLIVVCIKQVTDNPDLANQIFDTFRWLD